MTGLAARMLGVTAAMAALAGCISFGPDVPEQLITLTADQRAPAGDMGSGPISNAIVVLDPDADQRLNVLRVPVLVDASSLAYLKDATWVERPARQFRRLLAETIRSGTKRIVVEGSDFEVTGGTSVSGRLTQMGYDAQAQTVQVSFDAVVEDSNGSVRSRRFEAQEAGVPAEAAFVAPALNRTANQVAKDVAAWLRSPQ